MGRMQTLKKEGASRVKPDEHRQQVRHTQCGAASSVGISRPKRPGPVQEIQQQQAQQPRRITAPCLAERNDHAGALCVQPTRG